MKILIACESSGVIRDAFRAKGHEAFSCDIIDTGHKYHICDDVLNILDQGWDMMIAHPPCTYLSVSGMHWTARGLRDPQLTEDALDFVRKLMDAPIEKIVIENPVSVISTRIKKASQYIQPYQFGKDRSKKTGLWLKNLPILEPSKYVEPTRWACCGKWMEKDSTCNKCDKKPKPRWSNQTQDGADKTPPSKDRWQTRSQTDKGIAEAMADQWG
tara:strand:+ start:146 stop:787 length:642 start_codon:yes stop_codon:yes gene_type:complete